MVPALEVRNLALQDGDLGSNVGGPQWPPEDRPWSTVDT